MRRISLFCFVLCISFQSYSQIYFTYGYGGSFTNPKGLNQFVENYNATRSWLNKEMKSFSYLDGISVTLGAGFGGGSIDMEYALRAQKRFADGIDAAGDDVTRQVKHRQNAFAVSTGGMFVEGSGGVAFGLRTEFGNQKINTRLYETNGSKSDWEKYDMGLMVNTGPVLKIFFGEDGGLAALSLHYTFGLLNRNVSEIEDLINHSNPPDDAERFDNNTGGFGFGVSFGVFGS